MSPSSVALFVVCSLSLMGCRDEIDAVDIPDRVSTGPVTVDIGGDVTRDGGNDGEVSDKVDEVWLRVDQVVVRHDRKGWVYIDDGRVNINLMAMRDGDVKRIGEGDVYVGDYDMVRLNIVDSWIVVEGTDYDLPISNGLDLSEGLDLSQAFNVAESTEAAVWVGWDLDTQLTGEGEVWELGTDINVTVDVNQP